MAVAVGGILVEKFLATIRVAGIGGKNLKRDPVILLITILID